MLYDNVYIEKIGSQDDDTATVIVATTDAGTVQSTTFRGMAVDQLAALMRDMTAALTGDGSSVEDTLTAWALMHKEA